MNKKINESISFLLAEYRRLKLKEKNQTISQEEMETLKKLISFIGNMDE